jgi:hypothetical protein
MNEAGVAKGRGIEILEFEIFRFIWFLGFPKSNLNAFFEFVSFDCGRI